MPKYTLIYKPENEHPPRKGNRALNSILLKPGRNHFNDDEFKVISNHSLYQQFLNDNVLELISTDGVEFDEDLALIKMSVGDAEKVITTETDLSTLAKWQQIESRNKSRRGVLNAIARQIKDIEEGNL